MRILGGVFAAFIAGIALLHPLVAFTQEVASPGLEAGQEGFIYTSGDGEEPPLFSRGASSRRFDEYVREESADFKLKINGAASSEVPPVSNE